MTSHYEFFATAPKFTEDLLLEELKLLGADSAKQTVGGVSFTGSLEVAYKTCLWSRIANRVLLQLRNSRISNDTDLYDAVFSVPWFEHFSPETTFVIDFNSTGSVITHSHYGAQKCKDAIVDQFRHHLGERPTIDKSNPEIRINVHVKNQFTSISLDLSGHSLHQRGYRKNSVAAPLKENLAAAILKRSGWGKIENICKPLIDPMCGSGTLLIEAALMATNTAPGSLRDDFGFNHWLNHDVDNWKSLRANACEQQTQISKNLLYGSDSDRKAVQAAVDNAALAGMAAFIDFSCRSITELKNENYGDTGFIVTNAPYGERLSDNENLQPLYEALGSRLISDFKGWSASIVTSDPSLAGATNLRSRRRNKLYNGKLLCEIYHYQINEESVKAGKSAAFSIDSSLQNRLTKNLKRLQKWATRNDISCYRIYDADLPEFNFALDAYNSDRLYLVLQEYAAPAKMDPSKVARRSKIASQTVLSTFEVEDSQLFYKQRKKQQGISQYEKISDKQHRHVVVENGASFYVNFEDYLDTGLFLDHRLTRQLIREKSREKKILNLFCYTGSASVQAALGGAKTVTSVDMSNTYLSWCKDNFRLNGITLDNHQFIKADCLEWISREKSKYDLVFVDPPTFSNSSSMESVFDIQQDYIKLIHGCANLLTDSGEIIFSTNFRKFKFDSSKFPKLSAQDITPQTIPEDFSRNRKIHQCWLLTKIKTVARN